MSNRLSFKTNRAVDHVLGVAEEEGDFPVFAAYQNVIRFVAEMVCMATPINQPVLALPTWIDAGDLSLEKDKLWGPQVLAALIMAKRISFVAERWAHGFCIQMRCHGGGKKAEVFFYLCAFFDETGKVAKINLYKKGADSQEWFKCKKCDSFSCTCRR